MFDSTNNLPKAFRGLGFAFFMCGAFFHCIDFLGVEQTLEWGTGMGFIATIVLTVYFWAKYLARNKVWTLIF